MKPSVLVRSDLMPWHALLTASQWLRDREDDPVATPALQKAVATLQIAISALPEPLDPFADLPGQAVHDFTTALLGILAEAQAEQAAAVQLALGARAVRKVAGGRRTRRRTSR